jgi:hypothetical protein
MTVDPAVAAGRPASATLPRTLFVLTAVGAVLSGFLPVAEGSDGFLFQLGATHVVLLILPAVLLLMAAASAGSSPAAIGLGGGAGLALASSLGSFSILLWKLGGGHLGAGSYLMTITAILGLFTGVAVLGAPTTRGGGGAIGVVVVATILMSLGCTLLPLEYSHSGISWAQWNGFGDGMDAVFAFATQLLVWMPALAALVASAKRGRFGALYSLGASSGLIWVILAVQTKVFDGNGSGAFQMVNPILHPLAPIAAGLTMFFLIVALATSGSAPGAMADVPTLDPAAPRENPARWAADPLGRHEQRYWDGLGWTEHVADAGTVAHDDGRDEAPPASFAPPTVAVAVVPETPVSPFADVVDDERTIQRSTPLVASAPGTHPVLVLDTGRRVVLTAPLVIGRAPRPQAHLVTATLLPIDDHSMSVSATHLLVGQDGGVVWVEDTGSTNGSAVVFPSGVTQPLIPRVRVSVPFGAEVRFGERSLRIEPDVGG